MNSVLGWPSFSMNYCINVRAMQTVWEVQVVVMACFSLSALLGQTWEIGRARYFIIGHICGSKMATKPHIFLEGWKSWNTSFVSFI